LAGSGPKRNAGKRSRSTIDELPSGVFRVRTFAGRDPITKKRYDLPEVVPAGQNADREAERVLTRLMNQVNERRHPKTKRDG